jgi:branched-chain amino acid transport system substrate-binding protein
MESVFHSLIDYISRRFVIATLPTKYQKNGENIVKKRLIVLIGLITLFSLVACQGEVAEVEEPEEEASQEKIYIGNIQDLSGPAANSGKPNAWGVEYAVKVVNENGGINGRELEVITCDCKNDLSEGINCYRKLVDVHNVTAIIGPPLSNPASGWVDISEEDQVPVVGHFMDEICTTDPETGEPYPYMFLCEPSCVPQAIAIAMYALEDLGIEKFATIYNTGNAYAVANVNAFVDYMQANGGELVAEETFTWSDTDYSAQALRVIEAEPDAVFLSEYVNEMALGYDFLRDGGYEGVILGANTTSYPFTSLVKNDVYDLYFVVNYDMHNPELEGYERFQMHMEEEGADYPMFNVGFGWDAVQVLVAAMQKAEDPTDGVELRDLLEQTDGVKLTEGTITIDPETHRPNNMGVYIAYYDEEDIIRPEKFIVPDYDYIKGE